VLFTVIIYNPMDACFSGQSSTSQNSATTSVRLRSYLQKIVTGPDWNDYTSSTDNDAPEVSADGTRLAIPSSGIISSPVSGFTGPGTSRGLLNEQDVVQSRTLPNGNEWLQQQVPVSIVITASAHATLPSKVIQADVVSSSAATSTTVSCHDIEVSDSGVYLTPSEHATTTTRRFKQRRRQTSAETSMLASSGSGHGGVGGHQIRQQKRPSTSANDESARYMFLKSVMASAEVGRGISASKSLPVLLESLRLPTRSSERSLGHLQQPNHVQVIADNIEDRLLGGHHAHGESNDRQSMSISQTTSPSINDPHTGLVNKKDLEVIGDMRKSRLSTSESSSIQDVETSTADRRSIVFVHTSRSSTCGVGQKLVVRPMWLLRKHRRNNSNSTAGISVGGCVSSFGSTDTSAASTDIEMQPMTSSDECSFTYPVVSQNSIANSRHLFRANTLTRKRDSGLSSSARAVVHPAVGLSSVEVDTDSTATVSDLSVSLRFRSLIRKHRESFQTVAGEFVSRAMSVTSRDSLAVSTTSQMKTVKTERKAVKVLGTMFLLFVVSWASFFSMNLAMGICSTCQFDELLFKWLLWLGYASSILNPIIYTVFNQAFKRTFIKLLTCSVRQHPLSSRQVGRADMLSPGSGHVLRRSVGIGYGFDDDSAVVSRSYGRQHRVPTTTGGEPSSSSMAGAISNGRWSVGGTATGSDHRVSRTYLSPLLSIDHQNPVTGCIGGCHSETVV